MNFCRISPFHRTHRTVCRDPAPATGWGAPPGPDPMRRDLPSPVPTTRPVGGVPHLRTGQGRPRVAAVSDLHAHMAPAPALPGHTAVDLPIAAPGPFRGRGCVAPGATSRSGRNGRHAPEAMASRSPRGSTSIPPAAWWQASSTPPGWPRWPSGRGMPWTGRGWPCAWPTSSRPRPCRCSSPSCSEASPSATATTASSPASSRPPSTSAPSTPPAMPSSARDRGLRPPARPRRGTSGRRGLGQARPRSPHPYGDAVAACGDTSDLQAPGAV